MVSAKAIPAPEMPLGFSEALVATKPQLSLALHPNLLHLLWYVLIPNKSPVHSFHFRVCAPGTYIECKLHENWDIVYLIHSYFCCISQCLEQCLKGASLTFTEQINEWEDSHISSQRRIYGHGWILCFHWKTIQNNFQEGYSTPLIKECYYTMNNFYG